MSETYELKHPVERKLRVQGGGETVEVMSEVEVLRPTGADMRWLETMEGKPGRTLGLLGRLTKMTATQIDLLDIEDISEIGEIIEGFLPASLKDGKT